MKNTNGRLQKSPNTQVNLIHVESLMTFKNKQAALKYFKASQAKDKFQGYWIVVSSVGLVRLQ